MRKDYYVYFHLDSAGNIFYVGKGSDRRAWSKGRHPIWKKYVNENLKGTYDVEIYKDGLTEDQAEDLESDLILEYGDKIINWVNPGREFDYDAIAQYHKLRDKNRLFVAETRPLEKENTEQAVERYREALIAMYEYESITKERGLVADLGGGPDWGDPNILDRLTLCLIKLGRSDEAIEEADKYFTDFPSALGMTIGKRIKARVDKNRNPSN